jgi:hypothetical protein
MSDQRVSKSISKGEATQDDRWKILFVVSQITEDGKD